MVSLTIWDVGALQPTVSVVLKMLDPLFSGP